MSYGIIRIQKFKAGSVKGIQIHDQREKAYSHTNQDIDFEKSVLNYDLHNTESINFYQKAKERIKELNLKKAVRKDAVVMCQCLITSDRKFFKNMSKSEQDIFFEDAYNFVSEKYGKENIISATVHYDETTPHLHVNFVPVTSDGRLCARDMFKKQDLSQLQDDFYNFNQSKGYDLERGEKKGDFKKHLTTEEFKIEKMKENIEQEKSNLEISKNYLEKDKKAVKKMRDEIQDNYIDAKQTLEKFDVLEIIEPERAFIGGKLKLSDDEFEKLSALAKEGIVLHDLNRKYKKLGKEYKDLNEDYINLKVKSEISVKDKLKNAQEISRLKEKCNKTIDQYNDLVGTINEIYDFLEGNNLMNDFKNYQQEKFKQKNEREISDGWDLEM